MKGIFYILKRNDVLKFFERLHCLEPVIHALVELSVLFYRLKMKFSCMMELNKYPLDVQVCTMEVASCEYYILG